MTARPVDPDRTDAVARATPAWTVAQAIAADLPSLDADACLDAAAAILTTDDQAAVAALLATLAERHPDQYLTAGRDAGVLDEDRKDACGYCGVDYGDMHPRDCAFSRTARPSWVKRRRLVSEWREVEPE